MARAPTIARVTYASGSLTGKAPTTAAFLHRKSPGRNRFETCPELQLTLMDTRGKYTYRMRAFKAYPLRCDICGFSEDDRLLDIHHRDSDHNNAGIDNLQVLCVMCHAKITRKDWAHFVKVEIPEF